MYGVYIHDVGLVHSRYFLTPTLLGQLESVFSNAQGLGLGDNLQALHHSCYTLRRGQGTTKGLMGVPQDAALSLSIFGFSNSLSRGTFSLFLKLSQL